MGAYTRSYSPPSRCWTSPTPTPEAGWCCAEPLPYAMQAIRHEQQLAAAQAEAAHVSGQAQALAASRGEQLDILQVRRPPCIGDMA